MVNYEEAKKVYIENNSTSGGFPYGVECKNEMFVTHEVPLRLLRKMTVKASYVELMKDTEMDPIWIKTCNRGRPYWDNMFSVVDGNHRVVSAEVLGMENIKAVMPESHYNFWRSLDV